jgi:hypothetical protein
MKGTKMQLVLIESNGDDTNTKVLYEGEQLDRAFAALKDELISTATVAFSVPVVEWWFTTRKWPYTTFDGDINISFVWKN